VPLQSSGQITLDEIHVEAGGTTSTEATVNDTDIRDLISAASASEMEFADFYGADGSGGGGGGGGISEGLSSSLDSVTGTNASWSTRTVDISAYANEDVKLVFVYTNGTTGTSYQGDLQLDDIRLDGTTYSFESTGHSWQTTTTNTPVANYSSASFTNVAVGTTNGRWNSDAGGTPSSSTGLTTADAGTYYVYAETSGTSTSGHNYILRSPTVTLGSSPTLQYAEARSGGNIGTLNVYLDVQAAGGGGGGNSDFGSYSYSATNAAQSFDTLEQTYVTAGGSGNTCRIFVRFRLSGTTLILECSEKLGINATMRNANSSGTSTGSTTALTTAFTTMGTLTVPSTVDVKMNWSSTTTGTTGSALVTGSTFYSTTYALTDDTYQTLTNGESAGFYIQAATFSNGNRRIYGSMTLGVNATGYNENASIADHDFDVYSGENGQTP